MEQEDFPIFHGKSMNRLLRAVQAEFALREISNSPELVCEDR
jgi:hypothetical protein